MRKSLSIALAMALISLVGCSGDATAPADATATPDANAASQADATTATAPAAESAQEAPGPLVEATLTWREERLERLKQPNGWLSLVGLHWIEEGTHTLGSAENNDIQLATGPAHIGSIALAGTDITLTVNEDAGVTVDDQPVVGAVALHADSSESPSSVRFVGQEAGFTVIERSGKLGLRVKDAEAKTRTGFLGIDYFDITPEWRFDARYEAHPPGQTIKIASVINTLDDMVNPGRVIFEKDGQEYSLEAVDEGDGQLFLIFADRTSGKTTYGPGRFLYADPAVDGRTVVDFNRAYNPPCAFNAYSTCPLPPPENRLDLVINAGEKKYRGETH